MGFQVVPQAELYDAARRLALPFPVPADGIFTLERALQTPLAVTAEVRAAQGQYVVHLRVRVAVEPEERTRDVTATQFQLGAAIREALPALLVPPRVGQAPAGERPVSLGEPPPSMPPRRPRARLPDADDAPGHTPSAGSSASAPSPRSARVATASSTPSSPRASPTSPRTALASLSPPTT